NIQLGPGGVDGVFGTATADAVVAFKRREGLEPQDGVASIGTLSRLDQIYQHELFELAARAFVGTPFDPGPRQGDRVDVLPGVATCAFENTQMVEVGHLVALPVAPALLAGWQSAGGPLDGPGVPHTPPWLTQSARVVQTFANEHLVSNQDSVIRVPRDVAL